MFAFVVLDTLTIKAFDRMETRNPRELPYWNIPRTISQDTCVELHVLPVFEQRLNSSKVDRRSFCELKLEH